MAEVRIHRQSVQVVVKRAAQSDIQIRLFRIGIEVLGGVPAVVSPIAVPAGWKYFLHNWTKRFNLATSWFTNVESAHSSISEERRGILVDRPQRKMDVRFTPINPGEMDDMVPILKRMSVEPGVMPIFSDQAPITASIGGVPSTTVFCVTTNKRFQAGGFCVIATLNGAGHSTGVFQARVINEIQPDRLILATGVQDIDVGRADIYPLINVDFLLKPKIRYNNNHVAQVDISVEEIYGPSSYGPTESGNPGGFQVFKGDPIWKFEPNFAQDMDVQFVREGSRKAQGRSTITDVRGARARYMVDYAMWFRKQQTDNALEYIRFFDSRRGRLRSFWHVDQEDIWTIASQSNGDTEVNITAFGDFTLFEAELDETEPGHLGIVMNDGTIHIEEVTGIDDESSTWEVTLANAIPSLDLTQVRRVARARLCRFNQDTNEEQWRTDGVCSMKGQVIELLEEKEVLP